jgi:hypothetical protein
MLRLVAVSLGAALLLASAACTIDHDVSQESIRRGIANDIDETRRPAASDSRPVMPNVAPPIQDGGQAPSFPTDR